MFNVEPCCPVGLEHFILSRALAWACLLHRPLPLPAAASRPAYEGRSGNRRPARPVSSACPPATVGRLDKNHPSKAEYHTAGAQVTHIASSNSTQEMHAAIPIAWDGESRMRVPKKLSSYMLGRLGEGLAKQYLVSHGWDVLSMNFACKIGEVDIIAVKECTVAFVEVKTRTTKHLGPPLEAVDFRKQQRLKRIAQYYMSLIAAKFGGTDSLQIRFDVVTVIIDWPRGGELYYLEDAFS